MNLTQFIIQLQKWLNNTTGMVIQYFIITCILFFIFFIWKKGSMQYAKIQQKYPENKHIKRELFLSLTFLLILGTSITFVVWLNKNGYTLAYKPIDKYGWGYYFFSIFLMVLVHDTYNYWTHRLMHWKVIFKYVHKMHHESTNPTPFASYSFHPLEGLVQVSILFVIIFIIPHHSSAVTIFSAYAFGINLYWHTGHEFLPRWFVRHKIFKWHNTSVHHNQHHTHVKTNFGYYFNFWDTVMKTNHIRYKEHFEMVTDRRDEIILSKKSATKQTVSKQ